MSARIPATIVTGFLGAGKTTLLRHILAHAGGRRIALLVNEFGEAALDHLIVESVEPGLLALATGCICCSARGDLLDALGGLLDRRDAGRIGFGRVIVETTGLADPRPVGDATGPLRPARERLAVAAAAVLETALGAAGRDLTRGALMRALAEQGFAGYVAQEFIPTREPMAALADAVARCRV